MVCEPDASHITAFTMTRPMDAIFLDDRRVPHGVTPIVPHDATRNGHRDLLVLTFRQLLDS